MSRRGKWLAAALAAAALLVPAGWYFGSPWWTLWRMREAARAGNLAAIAAYVDLPRIAATERAQARSWWGSVLTTPVRDSETSRRFLALARRTLAGLDRAHTTGPEDLRGWLGEIEVGRGLLGPLARRQGDPHVIHHGLSAFEVRYDGSSLEYGPVLAFERRGLGWKLVGARWGQQ